MDAQAEYRVPSDVANTGKYIGGVNRMIGGILKFFQGVSSVAYYIASDDIPLPADSLAQTIVYNGSNQISTITVSYLGSTYVQTLTYTGDNLTGVSQWVKQ